LRVHRGQELVGQVVFERGREIVAHPESPGSSPLLVKTLDNVDAPNLKGFRQMLDEGRKESSALTDAVRKVSRSDQASCASHLPPDPQPHALDSTIAG